MSPQEELAEADSQAIENSQSTGSTFSTNVGGGMRTTGKTKGGVSGKLKKFGAAGFLTIALIIIAVFFLSGFTFPDAILTRMVEETDTQYADGVQSKELVFQEALREGKIPKNTAERLKQDGVEVGYLDGDTFIASNVSPAVIAEANVNATDVTAITLYSSSENPTPLSLKMGDKIITAEEFYDEVNKNAELYDAFTSATYGRAAYYYDEKAQEVFKRIGTTRNNFSSDTDLTEVMDSLLDSGNTVGFDDTTWHYHPIKWEINQEDGTYDLASPIEWEVRPDTFNCTGTSVSQISNWAEPNVEARYDSAGNIIGYYQDGYTDTSIGVYGCDGSAASSYLRSVSQSNASAGDAKQTVKNTTDSLKAADTITEEQRSMILYTGFMESISKMKAGYGFNSNSEIDKILAAMSTLGAVQYGSNINDVMNRLFEPATSQVVDVKTGEVVETYGSMLESPSMYAILAGEKIDVSEVANYSNDRILKTMENREGEITPDTIKKTVVATKDDSASKFGKYTEEKVRDYTPGGEVIRQKMGENYNHGNYSDSELRTIELTVQNSMFDNSFDTIRGISGGELLAKGAVSLGKELAKASGGTAANKEKTLAYMKVTDTVLALDAEVDRMHRSPLDITSQNTFLGSIVYKFAVSSATSRGGILGKLGSLGRMTGKSLGSLMPSVFADEESSTDSYLANFGDCQTAEDILGVVESAQCVEIAAFDASTYKSDIYQDGAFTKFLEDNIEQSGNTWNVKENSRLAMYVNYNEERETPIGLTDGAILEAYQVQLEETEENSKGFFGKIVDAVVGVAKSIFPSLFDWGKKMDENDVPEEVQDVASGKAFTMGYISPEEGKEDGDYWERYYKYAQRYISLARAAEDMRKYDGDETAYNFKYFGTDDAIARYIREKNESVIAEAE